MLTIVYSYGKDGLEASHWEREIASTSIADVRFVPFNHRKALGGRMYEDATQLDRDHRASERRLMALYRNLQSVLAQTRADCLFVTNDNVYHPDFLLGLNTYRCYYTTDDPGATYGRTIPYLHAFHHVFHCSIPYSRERTMRQKLLECGVRAVDFLPLGVFDFEFDPSQNASTILETPRDIDIIYIGSPFFAKKFDAFLTIAKGFGSRLKLYGRWAPKHSAYLSAKLRRVVWVHPVSFEERIRLYQRAKIGFNVHWDAYGLGNQRLYHLPANGVMQICDSPEYLGEIFKPGIEVIPAATFRDMAEQIQYYLTHEEERKRIALAGFRRTMSEYRMGRVLESLAEILRRRPALTEAQLRIAR
jgi:spore maturation protein CgeB